MTQEEIITSACDAYREGKQDLVGVVISNTLPNYRTRCNRVDGYVTQRKNQKRLH